MDSRKAFLHRWVVVFFAVLLFGLNSQAWSSSAGQYYRYSNERGETVIDEAIPPEFVAGGYDIITRDGTLIRRIPRQLTEEELLDQGSEAARERMRKEEEQRLQAWDEMLMLRYSSVEDIEASRERAVRDLQIRISILKSNLMSVKSQIEREEQRAADVERSGQEAPVSLTENIDKLNREIEDTEESIAVRRQEVDETKASYQRDIDRFSLLKERVNLRR